MASFNSNFSQNQSTNQAQNTANSQSQSSSSSFIPNYSQTPILERIAQHAESMAPQTYNWGMNQWANNQGDINKLMSDANRYEGQPQQAVDMGAAEAAVTNSGENARENSIRDLQSYGIDPSSGRYAALDKASQVQNAAAAAGAGNVQRNADMARANTERNQAISASLQNANFGNQVGNTANAFLGTAMRLPYSPLGTQSQSSSSSNSQGSSSGQSSGYSQGSGGATDPAGGGGGGSGGGGHGGGGQQQRQQPPGQGGQGDPVAQPTYPNVGTSPVDNSGPGYGSGGGGFGDPTDPNFDPGGFGSPGSSGGDPWSTGTDPLMQGPSGDPGGGWGAPGGDYVWANSDMPQSSGSEQSMAAGGAVGYDDGGDVEENQGQDATGGYDPEVDGQSVPAGHSPTGGQAIDDVPAKLTVGEFVMPDDVVKWKGEEFFQNLISKSRETRQNIMAVHGQTQGKSHNLGGAI